MTPAKRDEFLRRILEHPGVESERITEAKYLICYEGMAWFLWPKSGRYQFVEKGSPSSDLYFESVKRFYHRYITKTLYFPKNFGKRWSQDDEDVLYEMVEMGCSIRQIAEELERDPVALASKLATHLDEPRLAWCEGDSLDIGVDELMRAFPPRESFHGN